MTSEKEKGISFSFFVIFNDEGFKGRTADGKRS